MKRAAGTPKPHAEPIGHELTSKTRSRDGARAIIGGIPMLLLRIFALVLLVAPVTPAFAQRLMSPTAPTMEDVDPGIDETARARERRLNCAGSRCTTAPNRRRARLSSTRTIASSISSWATAAAMRYGVGVGRDGFQWGGVHNISKKAEWPDWTPPPEMTQGNRFLR